MSDLPLPLPDRRTLAKTSEQENNNNVRFTDAFTR